MSEHLQGPATFCAVFSGDTQILLMSRRGHAIRDDLHQQGDVLSGRRARTRSRPAGETMPPENRLPQPHDRQRDVL